MTVWPLVAFPPMKFRPPFSSANPKRSSPDDKGSQNESAQAQSRDLGTKINSTTSASESAETALTTVANYWSIR